MNTSRKCSAFLYDAIDGETVDVVGIWADDGGGASYQ